MNLGSESNVLGLLLLFVYCAVCGMFSHKLAEEKGYSKGVWFMAGLLFGVLSLIAVAGLPDRAYRSHFYGGQTVLVENEDGGSFEGTVVAANLENQTVRVYAESIGVKEFPAAKVFPK